MWIWLGAAWCGLLISLESACAQGSAFNYQGLLAGGAGAPLTGNYDLQFKLRDASTNQVGPTLTNSPVAVNGGLFTVTLDFGPAVFGGGSLWLEIGVRANGAATPYEILSPTQLLTAAPYAIRALTATDFTGVISDGQLSSNIAQFDAGGVFSGPVTLQHGNGTFSGALSGTFSGAGSGIFAGNGANLTNLNVTNLVGIVQGNLNWQLVQTTNQQAQSATDYLAANAAQTTLVLPAAPNVGNTLRISGSGSGGWVLAQNSGQSILTGNLGLPAGNIWVAAGSSPAQPWQAVASSANGLTLVAAVNNGFLYTSADGGQTWKQRATSQPWYAVASSADGTKLVAAVNNGDLYTSTDSGMTWTARATVREWFSVASSTDGTKLVAAVNNGNLYTSTDSGMTWAPRATIQEWFSVASSADGTKLVAAVYNGYLYTSADSGMTWTNRAANLPWQAVASSADGVSLAAVVNGGYIFTSGDSGANWTQRATSRPWQTITSSAAGTTLVAAVRNGYIYNSLDSGQTWTQRATSQPWQAVALSGDGTRAVAAVNGGQLYNSMSATTPGATGYLAGLQYSAIELQYIGNGLWMPLSSNGVFTAN